MNKCVRVLVRRILLIVGIVSILIGLSADWLGIGISEYRLGPAQLAVMIVGGSMVVLSIIPRLRRSFRRVLYLIWAIILFSLWCLWLYPASWYRLNPFSPTSVTFRILIVSHLSILCMAIFSGILTVMTERSLRMLSNKFFVMKCLYFGLTPVIIITLTLFLFEWYIKNSKHSNSFTMLGFELFPYTGWHVPSNQHVQDDGLDIQTGSMGFFTEFELEEPPSKAPGEFRIVLIGGSGAQGWGAQTNEFMLYRQLEELLNQRFAEKTEITVNIINMAMGGSITYQNFIALNRWGHQLEPDLILSYSGRNDFYVPIHDQHLLDSYYYFTSINTLVIAAQEKPCPPALRWFDKLFPNIMTKTNIGIALKFLFGYDYLLKYAESQYRQHRELPDTSPDQFLDEIVIPMYVDALKSIKRDFSGIPIMIAWQAISTHEIEFSEQLLRENFYNDMFERSKAELTGYMNDEWYFLNVHHMFDDKYRPDIATHPTNRGHTMISNVIAAHLSEIISRLVERTAEPSRFSLETL